MDEMTTPLLLFTGAGLPGWIWDEARTSLTPSRDSAVASAPSPRTTSLQDHAQRVLDEVPWPAFIVVAHSVGGVVATALAALAPQRVHGFLGVAAAVPATGRSFLSTLPLPNRLVLGALIRVVGTRPPEKAIRAGLTGSLDRAVADRIVADFSAAPPWLYRHAAPARHLPQRRGYLFTAEDKEFSPRMQSTYADELGSTWRRTMTTGHLPMLQDPAGFSQAVEDFCIADDGDGRQVEP